MFGIYRIDSCFTRNYTRVGAKDEPDGAGIRKASDDTGSELQSVSRWECGRRHFPMRKSKIKDINDE